MISEQTRKRLQNQSDILRTIRRKGATSRSYISKSCGIRKASVTNICRDLVNRGSLNEMTPGFYRSEIELSSEYWRSLAIFIGPGEIIATMVDHNGKIYEEWTQEMGDPKTPDIIVSLIVTLINKASKLKKSIVGIGISVPGIINAEKGICISAVNLGRWHDFPLIEEITKRLPKDSPRIIIENDANAELMGNYWFGAYGETLENSLYISLGEGIGCAQLLEGNIVRGRRFSAGEIGCLPSGNEKRPCSCGKMDCLQTYCGELGIIQSVKSQNREASTHSIAQLCHLAKNNLEIRQQLTKAYQPLVKQISTMVALTDPAQIVVGCPDPKMDSIIPEILSAELEKQLGWSDAEHIPVLAGLNPIKSGILGAAVSVFKKAFQNEPPI
ncbi:MAG: ROK family protein [Opitutales bacterium]